MPIIYAVLEPVYEQALHGGFEATEPDLKLGGYHLYVLMDKIVRLCPDFNPLEG